MNNIKESPKLPEIPEEYYPCIRPKFEYPKDFVTMFNSFKSQVVPAEINTIPKMTQYVFFCPGLTPQAITMYFLCNKKEEIKLIFYEFFSLFNIEYVPILDYIRLILPRIAFPIDHEGSDIIFDALTDAYYFRNKYIHETREDIRRIIIASFLFSVAGSDYAKSAALFVDNLKLEKSTDELKYSIYNSLKEKPIPISISDVGENCDQVICKEGLLASKPSKAKRKKGKIYRLTLTAMQCLKETHSGSKSSVSNREPVLDIPLDNVVTEFTKAEGKDPAHFTLRRKDNQPFGYKINKGVYKNSTKNLYTFYATTDNEINEWENIFKLITLYLYLKNSINPIQSNGKTY